MKTQLFTSTVLYEISEKSWCYKISFIAINCLLLIGLIWGWDYRGKINALSLLVAEHTRLRGEYSVQYQQSQNLMRKYAIYFDLNKQFVLWQRSLPTEQQVSDVLDWLNRTAHACGLQVHGLRPLQEQPKIGWREIALLGTWQGNYHGAACLAEYVANSPYKITIINFAIARANLNKPLFADEMTSPEVLAISSQLKIYVKPSIAT